MTQTLTKPKPASVPNEWPGIAHLVDKDPALVKKGDVALCGAIMEGILMPPDTPICDDCLKIANQRHKQ